MEQKKSSKENDPVSAVRYAAITLILFTWAFFQFSLGAAPLQAQTTDAKKAADSKASPSKDEEAVPRVSLGEITGSPGAGLMVPLYYTPDPNNPLRSISVDVEYVSNHLKYQKIAVGVFPDDIKADLSANLTDGRPDSKDIVRSKLHVTVALADKNSAKGLPDGLLAFLLFQVTMDAKPFSIKMTPTVTAAEDLHNPSKKMAKIAAIPGTIVVEIPDLLPEATCFFFSH